MKTMFERMSDEELKKRALSTAPHEGAGAIITALQAENEKLREALRGFVNDLTGSLQNRNAMLTINHAALVARIEQASKILEPKP